MIRLAIPANMDTTIEHLAKASRQVNFTSGDITTIEDTSDIVVRMRSFDIPTVVCDGCDVGLCGSDCVEERRLELGLSVAVLANFYYGRKKFGKSPTLDFVAAGDNSIKHPEELKPGSLIFTEHPQITKNYLESYGVHVASLGRNYNSPSQPYGFKKWCEKEGFVGITIVHGRIPSFIGPEKYGVMVNEEGEKMRESNATIVETIMPIQVQLIANHKSLRQAEKEAEIRILTRDLEKAFITICQENESFPPHPERR